MKLRTAEVLLHDVDKLDDKLQRALEVLGHG